MPPETSNPARGDAAGLGGGHLLGGDDSHRDTLSPAQKQHLDPADGIAFALALRAKIELLRWEIVTAIGAMQAALDAARAMAEIPSDAGLLHSLRVARGNGRALWGHAADLTAAHAELASVFRQTGEGGL